MVLVHRLPEHVEARGRQLLDADVQRMPRELLDLHGRDAMRTVEVSLLEQFEERAIVRRVVLGQLLVEEHRQLLDIVLCWIGRVFHAVSHVQADESTRFNLDCQRRLAVGLNLDRQGCLTLRPRELALGVFSCSFFFHNGRGARTGGSEGMVDLRFDEGGSKAGSDSFSSGASSSAAKLISLEPST